MMETCEVREPSEITNPRAIPLGMRAVSEGARLRARITEGSARVSRPIFLPPINSVAIWVATSRTSSARAAMYSSSIVANIPAKSSPTEITATSGLSKPRTRSSTPV
jgi:hypothetical protein